MHKAILFEAPRVLVSPVSGHWFIPPNFFQYIKPVNYEHVRDIERDAAFAQAVEQLAFYPRVQTMEEENDVFVEFYRMFFMSIPRLKAPQETIENIARGLVYDPRKFSFFPDALDVIPRLSGVCKLAVAADGWPSLADVFTHTGMRSHFSAFILSRQMGLAKPDPRLFQAALDELAIQPEDALYVDDSKENCDSARRLGLHTTLLCRDRTEYFFTRMTRRHHRVIRSLTELID